MLVVAFDNITQVGTPVDAAFVSLTAHQRAAGQLMLTGIRTCPCIASAQLKLPQATPALDGPVVRQRRLQRDIL